MTDASTQSIRFAHSDYRKPEPFFTLRTYLLIAASLVVTLLFVREYRHQQGPCRTEFKTSRSLPGNQPRLLRVQDDANPGDAGPAANPCSNAAFFGVTLQQAYAALTLVMWGATILSAVRDIVMFREDRRRRRMRLAYLAEIESQTKERQNS